MATVARKYVRPCVNDLKHRKAAEMRSVFFNNSIEITFNLKTGGSKGCLCKWQLLRRIIHKDYKNNFNFAEQMELTVHYLSQRMGGGGGGGGAR